MKQLIACGAAVDCEATVTCGATTMKKKILTAILSLFWVSTLSQCGDSNSLSKDVKFTPVPNNPLVVFSDITINPGLDNEFSAKAPWFLFKSKIENGTSNRLYLVTLRFEGTGTNNGASVKVDKSIDPAVACILGTSRAYLAILDPGATYASMSDPCDSSTPLATTPYESWYIHSLPETDTGSYSINVTGAGWFVDGEDVPVERLTMSSFLLTQ